jgi:hypothetical protein
VAWMHLCSFLLFTVLHVAITVTLIIYAFSAGMAEFDNPDRARSHSARVAGYLAGILMFPLRVLWTGNVSTQAAAVVEWLALLCNSAIWGAAFATGMTWFRRASARRKSSP